MRTIPGCKTLLILALIILPVCSSVRAQPGGGEITVFAIGSSRIRGGDMAAGREEAINAGLIMAVSRALGDAIPIESLVGHFKVVNETLLNRTDRFVRDYKVLTESVTKDTYRLIVQATVSVDQLKDAAKAAGLRLGEIPYPRVLLCVAEKNLNDLAPQYWWSRRPVSDVHISSSVLSRIFSDSNFVMVQPDGAGVTADYASELSAAEAMDLGRRFDAEVVVAGSALVEHANTPLQPSAQAYRGTIRTIAYRTADGKALAKVEKSATTEAGQGIADGGELLRRAAALAGEELSSKVASAWSRQAALGTGIEIRVQGVGGNIASLVKFRGALSGTSGVDNLQLRELASDTAVMTATYQGSARTLADAAQMLNFDNFRINVVQVEDAVIVLQLLSR
ncbi:MAG: hypothetical protein C4519_17400 [Desulfobacteraceae bacterium]|nr:MAG: hypothetical protein C4519_17400 [Desulfobacteraceae bacterium]